MEYISGHKPLKGEGAASHQELVKFCRDALQMEGVEGLHHATLRAKVEKMGIVSIPIFKEVEKPKRAQRVHRTSGDLSHEPTGEDDERWVCINIEPDGNARRLDGNQNDMGIVPIGLNGDMIYVPRGENVWIRGSFAKVLGDAKVPVRKMEIEESGRPGFARMMPDDRDRFEDPTIVFKKRYPYTVIEYGVPVKEGIPAVYLDTRLLGPERLVKQYRAAQRTKSLRESYELAVGAISSPEAAVQ